VAGVERPSLRLPFLFSKHGGREGLKPPTSYTQDVGLLNSFLNWWLLSRLIDKYHGEGEESCANISSISLGSEGTCFLLPRCYADGIFKGESACK
jgi:hypothetical protein